MEFTLTTFRFNKCPPIDENDKEKVGEKRYLEGLYLEGVHKDVYPLLKTDYEEGLNVPSRKPDKKKEEVMREETRSESVVLSDDSGLLNYKNDTIQRFVENDDPVTSATIKPLFPGDTRKGRTFWDEFGDVIKAQLERRAQLAQPDEFETRGSSLYSLSWPELWFGSPEISPWPRNKPPESGKLTLADVAESVAGEFSNYHQQAYLGSILKDVNLTYDMGNPFRCTDDFLGKPIRMAAVNAWSLDMVGPVNFNLKWHFGLPRPEEVAWLIHEGIFTTNAVDPDALDSVPEDVVMSIKGMELENATAFTAYGVGSPRHPSFPAMHSAGSTCSLWVPALYDINEKQYLEALRTDYGVAFARTVAGVHYPQDNLAGLNIGQRIVRERLPKFLSENYGYELDLVKDKVNELSFDWNKVKFSRDGCTIDGTSHIEFLENAKNFLKKPVQQIPAYPVQQIRTSN